MKKRMRKLALLTAAVVCLAAGPQSAASVEAASILPRATICNKCGMPQEVTVTPVYESKSYAGPCTDRSHVSLGCEMLSVKYHDLTVIKCNCTTRESNSGQYSVTVHSCEFNK